MGILWSLMSYIWPSAASVDPDVDPVTGLSRKEKQDVRQVWSFVSKDLEAAGTGFFLAYFRSFPEYQSKFKAFAKVPLDDLMENQHFQRHALNVMDSISLLVDTLDDPEDLVIQLRAMGVNHKKRKIESVHFQNLETVLLEFLQSALGPAFTQEAQTSWIKTMSVIVSVIETTLEK